MKRKILIFALISTLLFLTLPSINAIESNHIIKKEDTKSIETKNIEENKEEIIDFEKYLLENPQQAGIVLGLLKIIWNIIKWSLTSDGILAIIFKDNVIMPMVWKALGSIIKITLRILGVPQMIFGDIIQILINIFIGPEWTLAKIIAGLIDMFVGGILG